ncbi:DUF6660 family protein [Mucilaginibacter limnophilus]|uniref:DUF6660 family protein n=1 Tax=Mucilaginibacter limnophilus TaxID=1932778 RepID=UPI003742445A
MKFLYLILSVYVLMLSVIPCCTNDICNKVVVEQANIKNGYNTNSNCAACSPFYCCVSCTGFVVLPETIQYATIVTVITGQYSLYPTSSVKDLPLPIWQPPRLV